MSLCGKKDNRLRAIDAAVSNTRSTQEKVHGNCGKIYRAPKNSQSEILKSFIAFEFAFSFKGSVILLSRTMQVP